MRAVLSHRDALEEWVDVEELELGQECTDEEAARGKEAVGEKKPPIHDELWQQLP